MLWIILALYWYFSIYDIFMFIYMLYLLLSVTSYLNLSIYQWYIDICLYVRLPRYLPKLSIFLTTDRLSVIINIQISITEYRYNFIDTTISIKQLRFRPAYHPHHKTNTKLHHQKHKINTKIIINSQTFPLYNIHKNNPQNYTICTIQSNITLIKQ